MNDDNLTSFTSFGGKCIPEEIKEFIRSKNSTANVYRIQAHHSIMLGYYNTDFIYFMTKDKSLLNYTNVVSLNEYKKNDKNIL